MIFPGIFRNCGDGMLLTINPTRLRMGLDVHQMIQAWHHVHVPLQRQHVSEAGPQHGQGEGKGSWE